MGPVSCLVIVANNDSIPDAAGNCMEPRAPPGPVLCPGVASSPAVRPRFVARRLLWRARRVIRHVLSIGPAARAAVARAPRPYLGHPDPHALALVAQLLQDLGPDLAVAAPVQILAPRAAPEAPQPLPGDRGAARPTAVSSRKFLASCASWSCRCSYRRHTASHSARARPSSAEGRSRWAGSAARLMNLHREDVLAEAPGWAKPVWKHGDLGEAPAAAPSRAGRCALETREPAPFPGSPHASRRRQPFGYGVVRPVGSPRGAMRHPALRFCGKLLRPNDGFCPNRLTPQGLVGAATKSVALGREPERW
jgi:hypothetical protein